MTKSKSQIFTELTGGRWHRFINPDYSDPDSGPIKVLRMMENQPNSKLFFAKLFYSGGCVEARDDDGYIHRSYLTEREKLLDAAIEFLQNKGAIAGP